MMSPSDETFDESFDAPPIAVSLIYICSYHPLLIVVYQVLQMRVKDAINYTKISRDVSNIKNMTLT